MENIRMQALSLAVSALGVGADKKDIFELSDDFLKYSENTKIGTSDYTISDIEFMKQCQHDPIPFAESLNILHPIMGQTPFKLYEYQKIFFQFIHNNNKSIVINSRQMGITTCLAAYALHQAIYRNDTCIIIIKPSHTASKYFMEKIQELFNQVSTMRRPRVKIYNKTELEFDNGSRILCISDPMNLRGRSISHLIIDDTAFISHKKFDDIINTIYPCLTHAKLIMTSAAGKNDGKFYDIAENANNHGFLRLNLPWYLMPGRDKSWADTMKNSMGEDRFKQEYECVFMP